MKSKLTRGILGFFALVALIFSSVSPAQATGSPSSLTVSGFRTMSSTLTNSQKLAINAFVTANSGITAVSCTGYTGYNYLGETRSKIRALAQDRARKACNYAATQAGATVGTLSIKLTSSQNASARKVVIRFTYGVTAGRYQFSMSNLDSGSVLHGGAVTAYYVEGDLVASTFADGTSLDGQPQMGTIDGGSAAYFDHWNTSADDTGTSYRIGDRLGPVTAGTTVTLYAIAATG